LDSGAGELQAYPESSRGSALSAAVAADPGDHTFVEHILAAKDQL